MPEPPRPPSPMLTLVTDGIGGATEAPAGISLWWTAEGPADDPYTPDREQLRRSRERVLALADVVIPGHGAPFRPGDATPR